VSDMLAVLREHGNGRRATFPIRASLFADSWPALRRLLELPGSSLTLWSSTEGVPEEHLALARRVVSESQLYVDCDKGPRLAFYHPGRLLFYAAHVAGVSLQ